MAAKEQKPVLNEAGTHVYMQSPTGAEFECPNSEDVVAHYQAFGFVFCEPRDKSFDGLYDPEVLAQKLKAGSSKTGD